MTWLFGPDLCFLSASPGFVGPPEETNHEPASAPDPPAGSRCYRYFDNGCSPEDCPVLTPEAAYTWRLRDPMPDMLLHSFTRTMAPAPIGQAQDLKHG